MMRALIAVAALVAQAAGAPRFERGDAGEFRFDTGVLRGVLRAGGRSIGLSSLVHVPSGKAISRGYGVVSHYRVFTSNHRYGPAAWEAASEATLRDDGSVEARWPAAESRPFELSVVYRWSSPSALDVVTTVSALEDLTAFESFLASYFDEQFTTSMVYAATRGKAGFVEADDAGGPWQMFPRDAAAVKAIEDGRWTIAPNPVKWTIQPMLAQPLAFRRDSASGVTAVLMAPAADCFAIATPKASDTHYSTYLSLFGGTYKAGETARARVRLVVAVSPDAKQIVRLYRAYLRDLRRVGE